MLVTMPSDAGDDRFLGCTADEALDVRPHRHPRLDLELNAVLGDGVDGVAAHGGAGHVNYLRVHAGLNGLEDVAPGEIDGGGAGPGKLDARLVGGDHRMDDAHEI